MKHLWDVQYIFIEKFLIEQRFVPMISRSLVWNFRRLTTELPPPLKWRMWLWHIMNFHIHSILLCDLYKKFPSSLDEYSSWWVSMWNWILHGVIKIKSLNKNDSKICGIPNRFAEHSLKNTVHNPMKFIKIMTGFDLFKTF